MHVCAHGGLSVGALTHVPNRFCQFCWDTAVACLNLPAVWGVSTSRFCIMVRQLIYCLYTEGWEGYNRICASSADFLDYTEPAGGSVSCHEGVGAQKFWVSISWLDSERCIYHSFSRQQDVYSVVFLNCSYRKSPLYIHGDISFVCVCVCVCVKLQWLVG